MMRTLNTDRVTEGRWLQILLLTWAAGSMDALGYLGLDHVFTANMTGNTVLLGLAVGRGEVLAALRSVSALAGFVVGLAIGATIIHGQKPASNTKRAVSRAILVEGMVLAAFTTLWHLPERATSDAAVQFLIVLSAISMGIQSAVVRRLNLPGIATTYITGTLTSLVSGVASRLNRARSLSRSSGIAGRASIRDHRVQLQAGVILVYAVAAAISGLLQTRLPELVAWLPLGAIAGVFILIVRSGNGDNPAAV
jgi:uncharacterized membrane protein YoaK (UPF0700 family)